MEQTFRLKTGELIFNGNAIIILDGAEKQNRMRLITSGIWTFYGILSVLRYLRTGDQFLLWTGLFIGIGHLAVLVMMLSRTGKSEINKSEILSMEIKKLFGDKFLDIKLSGNKTRRVTQIGHIEHELKQHFAPYFETK